MKLATTLLAIGSVLAIASSGIANGDQNTPTNQYIAGSVTNSGATFGNYTIISKGTPTSYNGTLSKLNLSGTVTTQQAQVSKASTSRITNATILELAGITTRGATLGVFIAENGTSGIAVAVVKSGSTTTLTDISDFLAFSDTYSDGVTINSNSKNVSAIYPTNITIGAPIIEGQGDIQLNGETTLNTNFASKRKRPSVTTTATTAFRGFVPGIVAAPTLNSYIDAADNSGPIFPLTLNVPFSISPDKSENAELGQATWTATGLPQGFTINPLTGVISGTVGVGGYFDVYNVIVTVNNYYGSSQPLALTLTYQQN